MAKPIHFPEATMTWNKPENWNDEDCGSLPAYRDEGVSISCWRPSLFERVWILITGRVWLGVAGGIQPPVWVEGWYPFDKKEVGAEDGNKG